MKKLDKAVVHESLYVAAWVLILSAIMQAVFLLIGKWDLRVLYGNLLSGALSILNFFFMAVTVQIALGKEEKEAKNTMKFSQSVRTIFLFGITAAGVSFSSVFNIWTVLIPLIFPRVAVAFRGLFPQE